MFCCGEEFFKNLNYDLLISVKNDEFNLQQLIPRLLNDQLQNYLKTKLHIRNLKQNLSLKINVKTLKKSIQFQRKSKLINIFQRSKFSVRPKFPRFSRWQLLLLPLPIGQLRLCVCCMSCRQPQTQLIPCKHCLIKNAVAKYERYQMIEWEYFDFSRLK